MKVNIQKLQAGGYVAYQPIPMVPQQQAPPQADQGGAQVQQPEDGGYLDKSILEKMLGKGITTDVMQYSQELQSAYQQYQNMSDFQRNSYKGRQIRNMLKGDLGQLNGLMRAKDAFDQSITNAKSNDALDEIAVTATGVVARDNETGKVTQLNFAQYAKNKNKYTALTNAELAQQREYNKDLIGNSNVFSILNFGKGMSKVQEEVFNIVKTIGRSSNSVANGQFTPSDAQDVRELMDAAKAGSFKIKSGSSFESNGPQIAAAKQTMWLNLSANAKAVLRARAAQQVNDPSKVEDAAKTMMASLLDPHYSEQKSVTYDETMAKGGAKGKGAADKKEGWGPYGMAFAMANDTVPLSQIGPQAVRIDGFASAIPTEAYTGKDNQRVPLANAKLNNLSYISQAFTANGDKVDPNLTTITGDAYVTELPFTNDGNGQYKIDEEGAKKFAQYQNAKKEMHITDPAQDAQLREKFGVTHMATKKFIVAEATSIDKDFFSSRDKNYYNEVKGPDRDAVAAVVDPENKLHHIYGNNDAHKHLIYIPAKKEATWNAMDGHQAKIPEGAYEIQNGYNRGNDGTSVTGTSMFPSSPPPGLTDQFFNK